MITEYIEFTPDMSFEEENRIIKDYLGYNPIKYDTMYDYLNKKPENIHIFKNPYLKKKWVTLTVKRNRKSLIGQYDKYTEELKWNPSEV